eukprot:TRINITY_DN3663_c0_g1_i10.p1 TRINITY_DN3663_c0_g1~~TRINITY_DN3663_c0_g1_i10.p1  ORF type:complete len:149 (+),score=10.71 TRINITY_DN3663_c0_g1_i10:77-523(+)
MNVSGDFTKEPFFHIQVYKMKLQKLILDEFQRKINTNVECFRIRKTNEKESNREYLSRVKACQDTLSDSFERHKAYVTERIMQLKRLEQEFQGKVYDCGSLYSESDIKACEKTEIVAHASRIKEHYLRVKSDFEMNQIYREVPPEEEE